MNEATRIMLEKLAAKLGTTVDLLWGALVKQASISGLTRAVMIIVWITAFTVLAWMIKKYTIKTDDEKMVIFGVWSVWSAALLLFMFIITMEIGPIIGAIINPEYWALMKIMGK